MPDAIPFGRSVTAEPAPKSEASAEELLAFERMLADLSARFANIPAEQVEAEIRATQTIVRQFLGFDRSTFAEFHEDGSLVVLSSTAIEGVDPTPLAPFPRNFPGLFPDFAPARSSCCKTQPMIYRQKRMARQNISDGRVFIRI
jgi:hypothetical protein